MSQSEAFEQLLMGMIAGLFMRQEVRGIVKPFEMDRTEAGDALVMHFPDSWNTYRIRIEFIGNIECREDAITEASKA